MPLTVEPQLVIGEQVFILRGMEERQLADEMGLRVYERFCSFLSFSLSFSFLFFSLGGCTSPYDSYRVFRQAQSCWVSP